MSKIIPFGDRLLVRRKTVGEKLSEHIIAPDTTKDRNTDLADVVYVPDLTFSDSHILDNAEKIVAKLTGKAVEGDTDALIALLKINTFVKLKSIKVGDSVFISKYVGIDFTETGQQAELTLVNSEDIIGLVIKDKEDKSDGGNGKQ